MKMKDNDYAQLRRIIVDAAKRHGGLETIKQNYISMELSMKRMRWDLLHAANATNFVCNGLYGYLNDDHIDTALRRITGTT